MFDEPSTVQAPERALDEIPLERLEHEIVELASHVNAGMCRWLELVAEFDRREGWGTWGCGSCAEWVAWRCALDPRSAREHVRVARRLEDLPLIHAAFGEGRLSYSKVRALTRVADESSEAELIALACDATAAQLDRIVRGMRRMSTADARDALEKRFVSIWQEPDGSLSFNGNLPAEQGAAFLAALDAMHDLIRTRDDGGSAEPRDSRPATNADALVAMAEVAAGASAPERDGEDTPAVRAGIGHEIVVHVDVATLCSPEAVRGSDGVCKLGGGSALAPETMRKLACDAALVALVQDADGAPLAVGRRTRSVPPALRRALLARDGGCAFPGCENRRFVEAHHIIHWALGGDTSLENAVLLCRRHHTLVHEGGCSVSRERRGEGSDEVAAVFRDRHGVRLRAAPKPPRGNVGRLRELGPRAPLAPGTGERLDMHHTLALLAQGMG
jgi:hypothetical protein